MQAIYEVPAPAVKPDWTNAIYLLHMTSSVQMTECYICGTKFPSAKQGQEKKYCGATCQNKMSLIRKREKRAIAAAMTAPAVP